MKRKTLRFLGYSLAVLVIFVLVPGTTACSQQTSTTTATAVLVSVTIKPPFPSYLALGFTQQFLAIGKYSNDLVKDITSQVTWSSSDTTIAGISAGGLATSAAVGDTVITASWSEVTSAGVTLTVIAPTISSITVTASSTGNLPVGSTRQFTASASYSDNSSQDITAHVTWAASNPAIASVSQTGLVTGMAVGNTTIKAVLSGISAPAVNITVVSP
jgi:hypothetical protein